MAWYEIENLFKKSVTMDYDKANPVNQNARGIPVPVKMNISKSGCMECKSCEKLCPTKAIGIHSNLDISIDYGKCLHCGICTEICPEHILENSNLVYVLAMHRDELKINFNGADFEPKEFEISENIIKFQKLTKNKGFNYREVAAAGNNSVECELNASFNNVFDSEGQMVRSVASPKHADAVLYSGPISDNMADPLTTAWEVMPEPKALIAAGTEAISGGLFPLGRVPKEPDLFIGGDPPRPDVMINGYRYLMGQFKYSFQFALKKRLNELKVMLNTTK